MIKLIHKYGRQPPTARSNIQRLFIQWKFKVGEVHLIFIWTSAEKQKEERELLLQRGDKSERNKKNKKIIKQEAAPIKRHQWGVRLLWMMMSSSSLAHQHTRHRQRYSKKIFPLSLLFNWLASIVIFPSTLFNMNRWEDKKGSSQMIEPNRDALT